MANPKMAYNQPDSRRGNEREREGGGGGDAAGCLKRPKLKERVMVD